DLLRRIAQLVRERAFAVFAWALMPNHFHLLVRTDELPLAQAMRSLLTGFAGVCKRRHDRVGHLLQNRYKSIACEADAYFLELVRYVHLNPLRSGLVRGIDELEDYPYTGHSAILSAVRRDWQSTAEVLASFGRTTGWARAAYRKFVAEGALRGARTDFDGGGLVRSAGGWAAVEVLRRGREEFVADERILGGSRFVQRILGEVGENTARHRDAAPDLALLKQRVCSAGGIDSRAVSGPGRARAVSAARAGIAYLWVEHFGGSGLALALDLGLRPESVYKAAKRGRNQRQRWLRLVEEQFR
ncbi:MAG: transposase, partial [Candidatus Binatia bacterium]